MNVVFIAVIVVQSKERNNIMSRLTEFLTLTLPEENEIYDINIVNANNEKIDNHAGNQSNPHKVTASQVGLGNVNNTADANKPVSLAAQTALNKKADLNSSGKVPVSQLPIELDPVRLVTREVLWSGALNEGESITGETAAALIAKLNEYEAFEIQGSTQWSVWNVRKSTSTQIRSGAVMNYNVSKAPGIVTVVIKWTDTTVSLPVCGYKYVTETGTSWNSSWNKGGITKIVGLKGDTI